MRRPPPQVSAEITAVSFSRAAVSRGMLGGEQEGVGGARSCWTWWCPGECQPHGHAWERRAATELHTPSALPAASHPAGISFPLWEAISDSGHQGPPHRLPECTPIGSRAPRSPGGRRSQNTTHTPDTCHTAAVARCPACLPTPSCLPRGAADSLASRQGF